MTLDSSFCRALSPRGLAVACVLAGSFMVAHADALDDLRGFVQNVKTGKADFTQTVTSPDGKRTKTSSGHFEFSRPNRFLFSYTKPFEQAIVGDGQKVWIYDPDLNQASSRKMSQALGATPAALLAGGSLDADFTLKALPAADGLDWVQAIPKAKNSGFQALRIGFKGQALAALEIDDSFGQHSKLRFSNVQTNVPVPAQDFVFTPPKGADVVEQ
jgi:outer membrane lipoprotein carrier protein